MNYRSILIVCLATLGLAGTGRHENSLRFWSQ